MIQLLTDNHFEMIMDMFDSVRDSITIISPFLSLAMAEKLSHIVRTKQVQCEFITRLYVQDLLDKANSVKALRVMMNAGIEIYLLKGLHAKIYLFDGERAIVGSANFTARGFQSNIELSVCFEDEPDLLRELIQYSSDLMSKLKEHGGILTEKILSDAEAAERGLWKSNKGTVPTRSGKMFGVSWERKTMFEKPNEIDKEMACCKNEGEKDIVHSFFARADRRKQVLMDHNVWIKFSGAANDRINPEAPLSFPKVSLNGKTVYISNYSYNPVSVNENDEAYFAALTTDCKGKQQPVIVGRGRYRAFEKNSHVSDEWKAKYPWMDYYSRYVIIDEGEIIDTCVKNGLPLDTVLFYLGSDTYVASFGRNETIEEVNTKHYQKAHLRLSGNAKKFIDEQLDLLFTQFGRKVIASE